MTSQNCPRNFNDGMHCVHWWDNNGPCCYCKDDSHDEDEEENDERAAVPPTDGDHGAPDTDARGHRRRDSGQPSLTHSPLASSLLCPGCYSVVPPPGVRILIDSTDPAYPSPVTTVFCSEMCAESTATRQGFLRG